MVTWDLVVVVDDAEQTRYRFRSGVPACGRGTDQKKTKPIHDTTGEFDRGWAIGATRRAHSEQ
jgi:hypothetical protein